MPEECDAGVKLEQGVCHLILASFAATLAPGMRECRIEQGSTALPFPLAEGSSDLMPAP